MHTFVHGGGRDKFGKADFLRNMNFLLMQLPEAEYQLRDIRM